MCLAKTNFALSYDKKEKDYVGIGYKNIDLASYISKLYLSFPAQLMKWYECQETWDYKALELETIAADDGQKYHPGFHLFLNIEDAKKYDVETIYEFKFKNVIAAGVDGNNRKCPTVIVKDIKLIRTVSVMDMVTSKYIDVKGV